MTRSVLVGEVRTGRRITQIPVSACDWNVAHRGTGTIDIDIPLHAEEFRTLERQYFGGLYPGPGVYPSDETYPEAAVPIWRPGDGMRPEFLAALDPVRCFLAVLEDDNVIDAGPIWAHEANWETGILKVKASGLRSIFDRRTVMQNEVLTNPFQRYSTWSVRYEDLSLGTIAKRLVQLATAKTGGDLPIVLPDDQTGDHTRTYYGYELARVLQRLDELSGVLGGPDIAFEPRLTEDRLGIEWVMRVGVNGLPLLHQAGEDWLWDARVPRSGVSGLSVSRDAGDLAMLSWATGDGMEKALRIKRADDDELLDAGFPLLEITDARPSARIAGSVQDWADSNLEATKRPFMTWTATVSASSDPKLGAYRCGDFAKVWVPDGHPYLSMLLPNGEPVRVRIMNIAGGLDDQVTLTFAPVMESR